MRLPTPLRPRAGLRPRARPLPPRSTPAPAPGAPGQPSPEQLAQMEEALKDPAVQAQVAQVTAAMQSDAVQARFAAMRADPDLAPMFEDIQKNGMAALMKYMNDPEWLAKVGSKAGDVGAMLAGGAGGAGAAAPPPPATTGPVVNDIFDACKHNDMEALEDFIAIGKDVNAPDAAGRSPLHYAVAFDHADIVDELLRSGAVLTTVDGDGNTPLHYAAGYGRKRLIEKLVAAGANGAAENKKGQTPAELVTTEPRNPLHGDAEAVAVLENAALAGAE